jgi:regulator of sigma E protease
MSFLAAIVGLALLILIHEAGHFFAARAVGMTPRKFYLGFGQPIVKRVHNGVEYGIGAFPLGGYVKIPGMSRPEPGAFAAMLRRDAAQQNAAEIRRLDAALVRGDEAAAREELEELRADLGDTRAWQELEMSLAPDAYWRQDVWRRLVAIAAGPAVNLAFAVILFACVFMIASETNRTTNQVAAVLSNSPAAKAGLQAGDRVVRIGNRTVDPRHMAEQIRATHGRPFRLVVSRSGKQVVVPRIAAQKGADGAYRIGIAIVGQLGPGESVGPAFVDASKEMWFEIRGTVVGVGHLFAGRDTKNVSSSVGIVRASAAAWRQGLRDFLAVLGSISLALGILNLLPVLPFDGGHIVIALVEKVRGRTFGQGVYLRYMLVGIGLVAILMYIGLRNDLQGIFGG